jgi:hypothetical protein
MRKFWTGVLAAGFVATVGVSAQNAPQAPQTPGPRGGGAQTQASPADAKTVTVTGCIQAADSAPGAAAAEFVLAMKPAASGRAGGAVGTAGTTGTRYQLEGEAKEISPHLNHQVEITGMLEGASPAAGAKPGAAEAGAKTAMGPTLKVESLKMVSATCS